MKGIAWEAKGVELAWKNNREPLNDFQQGHDIKEDLRKTTWGAIVIWGTSDGV